MRKPQGYATIVDPDLPGTFECDTRTCAHCDRIDHMPALKDPADAGGLCKLCMGLICKKCVDEGICRPLEKRLQEWEREADTWRNYQEAMRR